MVIEGRSLPVALSPKGRQAARDFVQVAAE
jgi:hypothetical protein